MPPPRKGDEAQTKDYFDKLAAEALVCMQNQNLINITPLTGRAQAEGPPGAGWISNNWLILHSLHWQGAPDKTVRLWFRIIDPNDHNSGGAADSRQAGESVHCANTEERRETGRRQRSVPPRHCSQQRRQGHLQVKYWWFHLDYSFIKQLFHINYSMILCLFLSKKIII